jgi:hypothetical protein
MKMNFRLSALAGTLVAGVQHAAAPLAEHAFNGLTSLMQRQGLMLNAIQSIQYAGIVGVPRVKVRAQDNGQAEKTVVGSAPAVYVAQAVNEIFDLAIIPAGSRLLPFGRVECAAGAASSTLSIGLRSVATGVVVAAGGIATGVNLTAAGVKDANNGTLFAGNGYIATEDLVLYGTFTGATNTANQAITVYQPFLPASS